PSLAAMTAATHLRTVMALDSGSSTRSVAARCARRSSSRPATRSIANRWISMQRSAFGSEASAANRRASAISASQSSNRPSCIGLSLREIQGLARELERLLRGRARRERCCEPGEHPCAKSHALDHRRVAKCGKRFSKPFDQLAADLPEYILAALPERRACQE